ncbi:MAG: methyltransferase domain-containing protein [Thermomicrobiales bacterium]
MATQQHDTTREWGSDFFGTLNQLPPEPVAGIGGILEAMNALPAFRDARRWMLRHLQLAHGAAVLEGGCGTGVALTDLVEMVGTAGRVAGVDPTEAFIATARDRAEKARATNARYEVGDIRAMPFADGAFDAAFCDKVLIHAGPPHTALGEMARVVRSGGRVGVVEWCPYFVLSTTDAGMGNAFNAIFAKAMYDYPVSANLARHFHAAGLAAVRSEAFLAHTDSLDAHPFWRPFIIGQLPMFCHAGLIGEGDANALRDDLEGLEARGEFSASFVVQAAVGVVTQ